MAKKGQGETIFHFGPAGIGGVKEAVNNLEVFKQHSLDACEVAFTYGVYIHNKEDAVRIGRAVKKLGMHLSIHAPYYINLASKDKKKIQESKERILDCCEIGHYLNAKYIVFHAAYYGDYSAEQCYNIVKNAILDMKKVIKKNKWQVTLAPETTGKKTQFGTLDELIKLAHDTGCFFCVDFAHLLAREGKIDYDAIFTKLKTLPYIHAHFSGIEYTDKGEKRHVITDAGKLAELLKFIRKYKIKEITIINESPDPFSDSIKALKIAEKL